jgi:solute carrier family 25 citrate transporter 1
MSKKKENPMVSVLAGATAGGVEAIAMWPMEFIKTQLQLQKKVPGEIPKFTGIFSCAKYTIQTTGFFSLYRGLAPILAFSIPKAGIRFGGYKYFANMFMDPKTGKVSIYGDLIAGTGAGVVEAIFAVTPMETLKTRLIDGNKPFFRGTADILKKEGLGGVYKGLTATILKQGSNQGLRFMFFGQYKKFIKIEGSGLSPMQSLIGGMGAGCFSTIINNPFDTIKTRMQGLGATQYKSTLDCATTMLRKEGIGSFYRGCSARMGRVVPGQGLTFMTYEAIAQQITKMLAANEEKSKVYA